MLSPPIYQSYQASVLIVALSIRFLPSLIVRGGITSKSYTHPVSGVSCLMEPPWIRPFSVGSL